MPTPLLKVSKSQKHFFLKLPFPRKEKNIRQNSALESEKKSNKKDILLCLIDPNN